MSSPRGAILPQSVGAHADRADWIVGVAAGFVSCVWALAIGERAGAALSSGCAVGALVLLAAIDVRRRAIPNRLVYAGLALAIAQSAVTGGLAEALAGAAVAAAPFLAIFLASPGSLGGGDVKMAALAGAMVGYPGVVSALSTTAVVGAIAAIAVTCRGGRALAFGPFIATGALAVLLSYE